MRPPASSMACGAEQTLPFPPGGRNTDRMAKATSFVKRQSFSKRYFNGQDRSILSLIIAFARFIMDKTNNCTRRWKHEKAPHKANGIRSSIASDTYAYRRLRQPGAIRHRHRIGTRYRGNDHGSRVSSGDASCTNLDTENRKNSD